MIFRLKIHFNKNDKILKCFCNLVPKNIDIQYYSGHRNGYIITLYKVSAG